MIKKTENQMTVTFGQKTVRANIGIANFGSGFGITAMAINQCKAGKKPEGIPEESPLLLIFQNLESIETVQSWLEDAKKVFKTNFEYKDGGWRLAT